jgi:hypothetical protein
MEYDVKHWIFYQDEGWAEKFNGLPNTDFQKVDNWAEVEKPEDVSFVFLDHHEVDAHIFDSESRVRLLYKKSFQAQEGIIVMHDFNAQYYRLNELAGIYQSHKIFTRLSPWTAVFATWAVT